MLAPPRQVSQDVDRPDTTDLREYGDKAAKKLLSRFESEEGYRDFPETLSIREYLTDKKLADGLQCEPCVISASRHLSFRMRIRAYVSPIRPSRCSSSDFSENPFGSWDIASSYAPANVVLGCGGVEAVRNDLQSGL